MELGVMPPGVPTECLRRPPVPDLHAFLPNPDSRLRGQQQSIIVHVRQNLFVTLFLAQPHLL